MTDGRQFPRYAIDAQIVVRSADGPLVGSGRTTNLSRGGLCASLDVALPRGARVVADVTLVFAGGSTSEPLPLPARVAWSTSLGDQHQTGLSFLTLGHEQVRYLDMFVRFLGEGRPDEAVADDSYPGPLPERKRFDRDR